MNTVFMALSSKWREETRLELTLQAHDAGVKHKRFAIAVIATASDKVVVVIIIFVFSG